MQTIADQARAARPYQERLVPRGYTITQQDYQWLQGLAQILGVSESQVLRGVLARARELEANNGSN